MKLPKEVLTMKKNLGIFLVFTLLVGAGTIYASGHPGQNLSEWYKKAFQKESESLGAETATGMNLIFKEVTAFLKESKKDIDDAIAGISGSQVNDAKTSIERQQTETINNLNATVTELENVNFDEYVEKQNIEAQIDQDFEQMVEDVFGK